MALIENLDKGDWREFLGSRFDYTLDVLKNDRFRSVGSAVDDLRSWLARGGVSRVKHHLGNQMEQLRYPADKQADVLACVDQLARQHRLRLFDLIAQGVIRAPQEEWLAACDLTKARFDDSLSRLLAGERPFDDWMHAHGHSAEEIAALNRIIDEWITARRILGALPPLPPRRSSAPPVADHKTK
ncbi:MAG: hypothetical protein ACRD9Y_06420 [Blastocatellia bacterium]